MVLLIKTEETTESRSYYTLQILKLEKDNYILNQIIENDDKGYKEKEIRDGCIIRTLFFSINNIIKLSKNRFITISSHGFKVYSLRNEDDKCEYINTLLNENDLYEDIRNIYQITENEISIMNIQVTFWGLGNYRGHTICLMDKININDNEITKRIYKEKIIGCLSDISEYVIIKNKYFIVEFDNMLLILDMEKEIIINKILILCSYTSLKLFNFNYFGDTHFLVYEAGNIYLLKFKEKNNEIKIIGFLGEKRIMKDGFYIN